jgi:hypothetical protein
VEDEFHDQYTSKKYFSGLVAGCSLGDDDRSYSLTYEPYNGGDCSYGFRDLLFGG